MAFFEKHILDLIQYAEANMEMIIIFLVFAFVFLIVLALLNYISFRIKMKQRTQSMVSGAAFQKSLRQFNNDGSQSVSHNKLSRDAEILFSVERDLSKINNNKISNIRHELIKAGYFSAAAVYWYYAICTLLALSFLTGFLYISSTYSQIAPLTKFAIAICLVLLAYIAPKVYLDRRQVTLKQECWKGFPDFMDLLVVAAEAGLTPRSAIERISKELAHTYPYLGANLFYISLELQAGKPLFEAIENFAKRVGFEEVLNLGSLLQQTEELGTSLTDALRVYSDEMRDKRMNMAEEKAHALPAKLVIPLGIFVFPVILVVIMLPIVINFNKAF